MREIERMDFYQIAIRNLEESLYKLHDIGNLCIENPPPDHKEETELQRHTRQCFGLYLRLIALLPSAVAHPPSYTQELMTLLSQACSLLFMDMLPGAYDKLLQDTNAFFRRNKEHLEIEHLGCADHAEMKNFNCEYVVRPKEPKNKNVDDFLGSMGFPKATPEQDSEDA